MHKDMSIIRLSEINASDIIKKFSGVIPSRDTNAIEITTEENNEIEINGENN